MGGLALAMVAGRGATGPAGPTGATGPTGPTGPTGSLAPFTATVTNGEGAVAMVAGMAGYVTGNDTVQRAKSDAVGTSAVFGLITTASIVAGATGSIQHTGLVTLTTVQWDAVVTSEVGGLIANAKYYLDASTAGFLTATAPSTSGQYIVAIGRALSTTELKLQFEQVIGPLP